MKAKTLTATVAFTSLLTLGGSAFAADDPHDGYNRAFLGKTSSQSSEPMGKAAYGTPADTATWSAHEAYDRAFLGKTAGKPDADAMGKAAYGTSSTSIDGLGAYHGAFTGD